MAEEDNCPANKVPRSLKGRTGRAGTFSKNTRQRFRESKETIKNQVKPPGGFDPTPLPDAPQGYTVKFTFSRAKDLPIADVHTGRSDPYIQATLTTKSPNALKRHKEDPDLVYRTRPIRRCLDPNWNEEWTVANVPAAGFKLKCRLYDEDFPAQDDRLGNVTVEVVSVSEQWVECIQPRPFKVKKRSGSKYAYLFKAMFSILSQTPVTPTLWLAIEVLGESDPPHGHMYTLGPTRWIKHYSPMIGRMVGTKVNKNEDDDVRDEERAREGVTIEELVGRTQKYDFQANEIQLSGPVPPILYHRYVEFRPLIGLMFSRQGFRGRLLNSMLHKQHRRIYNFDQSTEYGSFEPCSEEASIQFLRMAHFDDGGRLFTYVLTLDGLFRFTETGKEFGIDLLSKHSLHADVATYIACSGEFFIRRELHEEHDNSQPHLYHHHHSYKEITDEEDSRSFSTKSARRPMTSTLTKSCQNFPKNHEADMAPTQLTTDGSTQSSDLIHSLRRKRLFSHASSRPETSHSQYSSALPSPSHYHLFIDNDSGTYRPENSVLPNLREYLEHQFPGLRISTHNCDDEELKMLKHEQRDIKKARGARINMVLNRSPSASSFSSSDESRLDEMEVEHSQEEVSGGSATPGWTRTVVKNLGKGKNRAMEAIIA